MKTNMKLKRRKEGSLYSLALPYETYVSSAINDSFLLLETDLNSIRNLCDLFV